MPARFSGEYDELQAKLSFLQGDGRWTQLNDNQRQFRHRNGGILNWFPSTGTINFQGKPEGKEELETKVLAALSSPRLTEESTSSNADRALRVCLESPSFAMIGL